MYNEIVSNLIFPSYDWFQLQLYLMRINTHFFKNLDSRAGMSNSNYLASRKSINNCLRGHKSAQKSLSVGHLTKFKGLKWLFIVKQDFQY